MAPQQRIMWHSSQILEPRAVPVHRIWQSCVFRWPRWLRGPRRAVRRSVAVWTDRVCFLVRSFVVVGDAPRGRMAFALTCRVTVCVRSACTYLVRT